MSYIIQAFSVCVCVDVGIGVERGWDARALSLFMRERVNIFIECDALWANKLCASCEILA